MGYLEIKNRACLHLTFCLSSIRINGIREICARAPLSMDATLLQDLTEYKNSHSKGIMMASRSLLSLYREINPELLKRKDRGKSVSMSMKDFKAPVFGGGSARGAEG